MTPRGIPAWDAQSEPYTFFQAADIERMGGMRHALERIGKINGSTGGPAALVREFKLLADLALYG